MFSDEIRLIEETDRDAVKELIALLEPEPSVCRDVWCGCCGNPTMELWRGDTLICSATLHHAGHLSSSWNGINRNAPLSAARATAMCAWLADRGVDGPLKERAAAKK